MKDNFEDFIQLYSGRAFHFGNPRVEEVHIEDGIDVVIRKRFNLPEKMSPEVKEIDAVMLSTERRDLMKPSELEWHKMLDPIEQTTIPRSPKESYNDFLKMFYELS